MRAWGLSESDILDVFNHGEYKIASNGAQMAIKKYSGYEIGLFYTRNENTGEYVITAVWKRDRR